MINLHDPFYHQSPVLNIISAHRSDRGLYRCIADNTVRPPARSDVKVYVNFRPFARPAQSSYGQAQNRMYDLVIECRIQGIYIFIILTFLHTKHFI